MARKRKGKFIKAFFGLVVIGIALTYAWMLRERNQTEKDLAAIKSLGVPTSIDEYRASLPHQGTDGEKLYTTALDGWNKIPEKDRKFIEDILDQSKTHLTKNMSVEDKKRLSDLVTNGASLFRRAASTDWADVLDNVGEIDMDKSQALQSGIKLLIHSADQKEPFTAAFNDIYYAGRIAGNSMRAPVGLGEIDWSFALERAQMDGWRQTLIRGSQDPKTVQSAERVLNNMPPIPGLPQVLHSMFVQGLWQDDNYVKYQDILKRRMEKDAATLKVPVPQDDTKQKVISALLKTPPANVERKRYYVAEWRELFEHAPKNRDDWRGFETAALNAEKASKAPDYLRDGDLIQFAPITLRRRTEVLAGRRIAKTALAIIQQRLKTGRLPTSIPKLGKDSEDPFTGKPLLYKRTNTGFIVYSVGRDEHDDGGVPNGTAHNNYKEDIVQVYR